MLLTHSERRLSLRNRRTICFVRLPPNFSPLSGSLQPDRQLKKPFVAMRSALGTPFGPDYFAPSAANGSPDDVPLSAREIVF